MIAAAVVVSVALPAGPAAGHHRWKDFHWPTPTDELRLTVVDSLGEGFRRQEVLDPMIARWASAGGIAVEHLMGDNDATTRAACELDLGTIRICNGSYNGDWLGFTELQREGDHILGIRVRVNDRFGTGARFRRFVLCHELGHSLGLWHRSGGDSCLNDGLLPDAHDLHTVAEIYEHTDAPAPKAPDCFEGVICGPLIVAPAAPGSYRTFR